MYSSTRTLPASQTRPRSLRSRSMSMMCSARSLGCATSSAVSRRSWSAIPGARARAGDGPRRNVAALDAQQAFRRRRQDAHAAEAARWRRTAPGWRGASAAYTCAGVAPIAQLQPPGTREVRLVDVARRRCVPGRARTRARKQLRRLPPRSDRQRGSASTAGNGCAAAACRSAISRACAAASPSSETAYTRVGREVVNGEVLDAQRERRVRRFGRRQLQAAARFPPPARSPDTRTSRRGTAAACARIARRALRARNQASRLSRNPPATRSARPAPLSLPARIAAQRGARLGGQHAVARQRALRGAVEEHGITRRLASPRAYAASRRNRQRR